MSPKVLRDLGTLIFAFVMLWGYVSFSQYLIIWSGNLPEEIPWYIQRSAHGWQAVTVLLVVFHFALPFSLLLSRRLKRQPSVMAGIAALMLVMRWVDLVWYIVPSFGAHGEGPAAHGSGFHWMDLAAPVGIGGLWIWAFARQMVGKALVPLHDPRIEGTFASAEGGH